MGMIEIALLQVPWLGAVAVLAWMLRVERADKKILLDQLQDAWDRIQARDLPEYKAVSGKLGTPRKMSRMDEEEAAIDRRRRGIGP